MRGFLLAMSPLSVGAGQISDRLVFFVTFVYSLTLALRVSLRPFSATGCLSGQSHTRSAKTRQKSLAAACDLLHGVKK